MFAGQRTWAVNGATLVGPYLGEDAVHVSNDSLTIRPLILAVDVGKHRAQMRVSMQPEQPMDMKRPSFIGLHSAIVLADAPEYRLFPDFHVMVEEQLHLPVEEYGGAHGIRYGQPCPFVRISQAFKKLLGRVGVACAVCRQSQLHGIRDVIRVESESDGRHAVANDERLDFPPHIETNLSRHGLPLAVQRQAPEKLVYAIIGRFARALQLDPRRR